MTTATRRFAPARRFSGYLVTSSWAIFPNRGGVLTGFDPQRRCTQRETVTSIFAFRSFFFYSILCHRLIFPAAGKPLRIISRRGAPERDGP